MDEAERRRQYRIAAGMEPADPKPAAPADPKPAALAATSSESPGMTDVEIQELVNSSMAAQKKDTAMSETLEAVSSSEHMDSVLSATDSLLAQVQSKYTDDTLELEEKKEALAEAASALAATKEELTQSEKAVKEAQKKVDASTTDIDKLVKGAKMLAGSTNKLEDEKVAMHNKTEASKTELGAEAKANVQKARELELQRSEVAERLYMVQATVDEAQQVIVAAEERAAADRKELQKLQVEKEMLLAEMAEFKKQIEVAECGTDAIEVAKLENRLISLEKDYKKAHPEYVEQVGASDSKLESLAAADVASKPEEKEDKPAMTDAELFRLRMRLISKGYNSEDADKTIAAAMEEGGVKFEEPPPKSTCCGVSTNFCSGMWCGLLTGAIIGAGTVLGITYSPVIVPVAVSAGDSIKSGAIVAGDGIKTGAFVAGDAIKTASLWVGHGSEHIYHSVGF